MRLRRASIAFLFVVAVSCGDDEPEEPTEESGPPGLDDPCLVDGEACEGGLFCVADGCFENASGTCEEPPDECDDEPSSPVCGCDGMTYLNRCEAHMMRRNVEFSGPCPD